MKYFISQPMTNRTPGEIKEERARITEAIIQYDNSAEIIDSYEEVMPDSVNSIWMLGDAIKKLSYADAAVFVHGWSGSRGCIVERSVCLQYDIRIIEEYEVVNFETLL